LATETPSSVVRSILTANLTLTADEVIRRAKARGVTAPPEKVRALVHNIRSEVKKAAGASRALPVPPKPTAASSKALPVPPAETTAAAAPDLPGVLANVALVHRVVGAAGGVEPARQVAEAVRACGGVGEFLQHLDLIAGIQGGPAGA
jgi:hypothetical protein